MERWLAIGTAERWRDRTALGHDLKATAKWRPSARVTITEVVVLEDGRFVAECHAPDRQSVERWLVDNGCAVETLSRIAHLARTGEIWDQSIR